SSSTTARMVSAMLSPVSPSATGKTFRSLTSWRRFSSSPSAAVTTRLKRIRLSSAGIRTLFYTKEGSGGLRNFSRLEAAGADVLAPGSPPDVDADLLEVRVEAPLRGHHGVAAAVPERGPLSTRIAHLCHGASG